MLAQRQQIKSMFGPGQPVLQGYFEIHGQPTNDEEQFVEGADLPAKKAQVWLTLKPALETAWKTLDGHHFDANVLEEFRARLLVIAFEDTKTTLRKAVTGLEALVVRRTEAELRRVQALVPMSDRASPGAMGGKLNPTPAINEREKHNPATYRRSTKAADTGAVTVTEETFDPDAYTKGPSRRDRAGGAATTPTGVAQAWTKKQVKDGIESWACEAPLARHLALTIWPLLTDSETGRNWELKFREMDRLITVRDAEPKSRYIVISSVAPKAKVQTLDRHTFNVAARQAMKAAIVGGTKHPAKQQGVLFYDTLLKAAVTPGWQAGGPTFGLGDTHEAGDLSMILTHWRPVLFFDWILAEDVMNNATG